MTLTYRKLCQALIYSSLDPEKVQMYWIEDELDKDAVIGEITFEDGGQYWESAKDDEFAIVSSNPEDLPLCMRKYDYIHIETADGATLCVFPLTD